MSDEKNASDDLSVELGRRMRVGHRSSFGVNRSRRSRRRGAILVLLAVLMPVIAIMAAFAVDIAWMQLVRTELRTATDAAARAGAKSLSIDQDLDIARGAAIAAAARNQVAGQSMRVGPEDVVFGSSEQSGANAKFEFNPSGSVINGVRVDGRRTAGSAAGPVGLFFGRLMGVNEFEPTHVATSTILDRDIVLVIDRSGSMGLDLFALGDRNGQNCGPLRDTTRFVALARAVDAFIAELDDTIPNEQLALASYSSNRTINCGRGNRLDFDTADVRQELSSDYSLTRAEMQAFIQNGIGGSTAIGEGLRAGIREITSGRARPFAIKTIVLMTDGIHNTGVEPTVVARDAAANDITVHTVTFSAGADQRRMRRTAAITGGDHFHADTADDLAAIFREIARTLPVLLTE
ncbi:MAG: vWA domain-containing protein [Planctomycetota bacterium]